MAVLLVVLLCLRLGRRRLLLLFQTLISEVTERIPFILSHNIRSGCNLIMHPQTFVDLYPRQKNHPKPPKMGIS